LEFRLQRLSSFIQRGELTLTCFEFLTQPLQFRILLDDPLMKVI
jgi:hypothetical protein